MKHLSPVFSFLLLFFACGGGSFANDVPADGSPGVENKREVWIAIRTDGKAGSGKPSDPFDGSTAAKFDSRMRAIPARTTIHLAAGTFRTSGQASFHLKTGWKIDGAGMGQTTLRLIDFDRHDGKSRLLCSFGKCDDVEVHDLTIDGNYAAIHHLPGWIPGDAVCGIDLCGDNAVIENVETIHLYGDRTKNLEEFSIVICGSAAEEIKNCKIIHCFTHQYAISPKAGSSTFGPGLAYCNGGEILNCTDDGALHGIGGGIGHHTLIQGNTTTTNTRVGWYSDTATLHDVTIASNHFGASQIPLQWNNPNPGSSHLRIIHNTFLTATNFYGTATAAIRLDQGGLSDVLIRGNHVVYTGKGNYQLITNGCHNTGLTIEDNSGTASAGGSVFLSYDLAQVMIPGNTVAHNNFKASTPGLSHP